MPAHAHEAVSAWSGLVLLVPAGALVVAYLVALRASRRRGRDWSRWRTTSFGVGIGLLAAALAPATMAWAHLDFRGHMAQHLVLGMAAPLALVLGAPVSLFLRAASAPAARRVIAVLCSAPVRVLAHPFVVLVPYAGALYALYLTPLYAASSSSLPAHVVVHAHFLASGVLFAWSIAGPDPAPHRPGFAVRLAALFVAMAAHAHLAKLLYARSLPAGVDPAAARDAAQLMYYGGDLLELVLLVALFVGWYRRGGRRLARRPVAAEPRPV